jgi:uncharacterized membrane protein YfcA
MTFGSSHLKVLPSSPLKPALMFILLAFVAGAVRGYSGFGFAMILALGLLCRLAPTEVIPVVLTLDLVCSVSLWPAAVRVFDRVIGLRLVLGMWLAVPLGSLALARLPEQWMALVAAGICLAGGVLVLRRTSGDRAWGVLSKRWAFPAGLASGLSTALASAGGPPLVVYLLRSGLGPAAVRGTAILFFAISSASALALLAGLHVLHGGHLQLAASLLVPALAGNILGQWLFRRWPRSLQQIIGVLLVLLAAGTLASRLAR